jgi:hypothetical protein
MIKFLEQPISRENVKQNTAMMSWERYAAAIMHA